MNDRVVCKCVWVKNAWEGETGLPGCAKGGGLGVAQHWFLREEWRQKKSFTSPLCVSSKEAESVYRGVCGGKGKTEVRQIHKHTTAAEKVNLTSLKLVGCSRRKKTR